MFTKYIALREKSEARSSPAEDNSHIYYSNRSAAYVKLGQFELAKRDALESIERSRGGVGERMGEISSREFGFG